MLTFPKLALFLTAFTILILGLHLGYVIAFVPEEAQNFKFIVGYVFLFILTLGLFGMVTWVKNWDPNKMGMAFLVGSGMKMLFCLFFILLLVYQNVPGYYALAIQFMIPYMLFLVFEVVLVLKMLKEHQ